MPTGLPIAPAVLRRSSAWLSSSVRRGLDSSKDGDGDGVGDEVGSASLRKTRVLRTHPEDINKQNVDARNGNCEETVDRGDGPSNHTVIETVQYGGHEIGEHSDANRTPAWGSAEALVGSKTASSCGMVLQDNPNITPDVGRVPWGGVNPGACVSE